MAVVYLSYLALIVVAWIETWTLRQEGRSEDYETMAQSRFTIPVSIVVPAFDEEAGICDTVRSLLCLDYPEFEVIVVNDGSRDGTIEQLRTAFPLSRVHILARRILSVAPIRAVYRMEGPTRLLVIDKANGGKADSLNAAINYARFRYVCCVDADTVLAPDSLLRAMRLVIADPAVIVGLTSYLTVARDAVAAMSYPPHERRIDRRLLLAFQHLDFVRSFFNNRLAWSRLRFMLCASGAFQIWRRDVLEQLHGFSSGFTCEDIEFTFRVHEHFRRRRVPYRVLCMPDEVGVTEGPDTVKKLISQRERWHRVTLETLWHYRRMILNPRYGSVGMVGVPFYLLSEALAAFFEVFALVTLVAGAALGLLDLRVMAAFLVLIMFTNALITTCAVLADDAHSRTYRARDLAWLVALTPLDLVVYRPLTTWARAQGTLRFLRRDTSWDRFARNKRVRVAPAQPPHASLEWSQRVAPNWYWDVPTTEPGVALSGNDLNRSYPQASDRQATPVEQGST